MTVEQTGERTEAPDGMVIDWDVNIPVSDGLQLRANVFRPAGEARYPVLLSHGPYGKDLPMQVGFAPMWHALETDHPDAVSGSSNRHQCWELLDPERWVPHGYVLVRVDSRGSGRSPGRLDFFSPREIQDFAECIEWAADQPWSTGKVGLAGISYYATSMWHVAGMQPPPRGLAAVAPWEGNADRYRDNAYHGGIPCSFIGRWFTAQVARVQHGAPDTAGPHPVSGLRVTGDDTLPESVRVEQRVDLLREFREHPFDGPYWRERSGKTDTVSVPLLSAGNWGGQGLHLRGNVEGFVSAPTEHKWLEMHGLEHWTAFYTDYGQDLQRRFFDWFLKGEGDWLETQPPLQLQIRQAGGGFVQRAEHEWPLARTEWTRLHLDSVHLSLSSEPSSDSAVADYEPFGEGVTFWTSPLERETELTGPLSCRLWISSETADADLFLVVRAFDPAGDEVLFAGSGDPRVPVAQGWLRASHRELDGARSTPWRPFLTHRGAQPLTPGEPTPVDVEIWPTCVVLPAGYRIALSVLGRDFDHGLGPDKAGLAGLYAADSRAFRGCGPWVHDDPVGRPAAIYNGRVTVHTGGPYDSSLLLPIIPAGAKGKH